jgi:hypothetical protein
MRLGRRKTVCNRGLDCDPLGRSGGGRPAFLRPGPTRAGRRLKKHEEWLFAGARPDTGGDPSAVLERQQKAGIGSVWRFFDRHGISFKRKRSGG